MLFFCLISVLTVSIIIIAVQRADTPLFCFAVLLVALIACIYTAILLFLQKRRNKLLHTAIEKLKAGGKYEAGELPQKMQEFIRLYRDSVLAESGKPDNAQEMKFRVLLNQINPHFLYNTLESIRSVAICDGEKGLDQIAAMTAALAKYFRYNISYSNDLVTLADEIENINQYMLIQRFRFSDRFQLEIKYNCDRDAALKITLPRLILQPIIENAIFHGLETKSEPGRIIVRIDETPQRVIICVEDNGVGIKDEDLVTLQDNINAPYHHLPSVESGHNGIALWQINQQIMMLFGKHYGIKIFSTQNVGTVVEITLPSVRKDQHI